MDIDINDILYKIAAGIIPVLFAITLHEVAHGWVANKLGDGTAKMLGRLTVNPLKHIDPIGTVALPLGLYVFTGFIFGWAKPVPVNTNNLQSPRKDMAIVAIAGPVSNIIMALFWVIVMKFANTLVADPNIAKFVMDMAYIGILINLILFIFNLFPIPPLDGSKVLAGFVPRSLSNLMDKIEPYGFFILIGLVYFGILGAIITPSINFFLKLFF